MYQPPHFVETRPDVLHDLIRRHPLATLVTLSDGMLAANHIPMMMDASRGPLGILRAHVAKGNELARVREPIRAQEPARAGEPVQALAVFQGADAYISPS